MTDLPTLAAKVDRLYEELLQKKLEDKPADPSTPENFRRALMGEIHSRDLWEPLEPLWAEAVKLGLATAAFPGEPEDLWAALRFLEGLRERCHGGSATMAGQNVKARPRRRRMASQEVNQAMLDAIDKVPDRLKWSIREWQEFLGGCSTSTIQKTDVWRQGQRAREVAQQERKEAREQAQGDRRRRGRRQK
jgi:hypothetical protein